MMKFTSVTWNSEHLDFQNFTGYDTSKIRKEIHLSFINYHT